MNPSVILPELILLTVTFVVLMVSACTRDSGARISMWLSQLGLIAALLAVAAQIGAGGGVWFDGLFVNDPLSIVLKLTILLLSLMVLVYSRAYLSARGILRGEYLALLLFAVQGTMIMASAHHLLSIYLGLELLSLSLYAMVAMQRDSKAASEAAAKYFVLGAIASGMLLYGMSIIYGVTGTLAVDRIAGVLAGGEVPLVLSLFGTVFMVAGVAFKLGAAPFHMWLPDVYHGAPTAVTLFLGTVPKLAAYAMAVRILADALGGLAQDWNAVIVVLALLSVAVGNVIAIAQSNIKRMLAYSAISHIGYLLLGVAAGNSAGFAGALFYMIVYALMSAGAFGMVVLMGADGTERDALDDFRGLSARSPYYALLMLVLMFSMAGVPPFAGFWAKWFVLREVVGAGLPWVAVTAVVFSVIGAYYYLRVVRLMYFDEGEGEPVSPGAGEHWTLSLNTAAVLALGLVPGSLMLVCLAALGA
ncbi:MAG: NADH-quinone oxidoreductase subunit NuoN [Gammaproteobacteria bacterium]|nr:MAG: NADH-quinone oxidoreductase subunit NuoN [Gammaproteobacteria bacterium]